MAETKWVAVATAQRSKIPAVFGTSPDERFIKYQIDDKIIYKTYITNVKDFAISDAVTHSNIVAIIVNDLTPEFESQLKDLNVEIYKGFSGSCQAALEKVFFNK